MRARTGRDAPKPQGQQERTGCAKSQCHLGRAGCTKAQWLHAWIRSSSSMRAQCAAGHVLHAMQLGGGRGCAADAACGHAMVPAASPVPNHQPWGLHVGLARAVALPPQPLRALPRTLTPAAAPRSATGGPVSVVLARSPLTDLPGIPFGLAANATLYNEAATPVPGTQVCRLEVNGARWINLKMDEPKEG